MAKKASVWKGWSWDGLEYSCFVRWLSITKNRKWRNTKSNGKFLFPVKALSKVFRGIFTYGLIKLDKHGAISLGQKFIPAKKYVHPLYKNKWVVYAKLPMGNAMQVVNYIGRYSHRIAISNHRIKNVRGGMVEFSYFNYRTSKNGTICLTSEDFLQRFALHILPVGYMKIRHYGILAARKKAASLYIARKVLGVVAHSDKPVKIPKRNVVVNGGRVTYLCPVCKTGGMVVVEICRPNKKGSPFIKKMPNNILPSIS